MQRVDPDVLPISGEVKSSFDNAFYYWTRNRYAHFVVFRFPTDRSIGIRAKVKQIGNKFHYHVAPPDWWVGDGFQGERDTIEEAIQQANFHLGRIIDTEFREEFVPPLG